jgi:hypothetical protein
MEGFQNEFFYTKMVFLDTDSILRIKWMYASVK